MKKIGDWFRKEQKPAYDPAELRPAVRASICTGERVAGFTETATGRFREVMLLKNDEDLKRFRKEYGIDGEIPTIY